MGRGKYARLPESERDSRISDDGLSITVWDEPRTLSLQLSFADSAGTEQLRKEWVLCIYQLTSQSGPWRSLETTRACTSRSRFFLDWLSKRTITTLDDITPKVWDEFLHWVQQQFAEVSAKARNSRTLSVRRILSQHVGLTASMQQVLSQRYSETVADPKLDHYTISEFQNIRSKAVRNLREAWARIQPNWILAMTPHEEIAPEHYEEWLALNQLLRAPHQRLSRDNGRALGLLDRYLNVRMNEARLLLFLTTEEGISAYAAIIATTGENSSTTTRRKVPSDDASVGSDSATIYTSERYKPRRGAANSLMAENASIDSPLGALLQLIMNCTEPARFAARTNPDSLRGKHPRTNHGANGSSSESLILFSKVTGELGRSVTHIPKRLAWMVEGLELDLSKLHRTYQTRVAQHPTDNHLQTWIDAYLMRDPERLQQLEDTHRTAQNKAVAASRQLAARLLTEDQAQIEGLDTTSTPKGTRCADILHNPQTGTYCSKPWLACLGCKNAYIPISNLPALVALLDLLNAKQRDDDDRERWQREFLLPQQQVLAILSELDQGTIDLARANVTPELRSAVWNTIFVEKGDT